jgi:hypothetical protein
LVVTSPYAEGAVATHSVQPESGVVLFVLKPSPWWVRVLWPLLKW